MELITTREIENFGRNWRVVGPSQRMLVMENELFHHIETELFVTGPTIRFD